MIIFNQSGTFEEESSSSYLDGLSINDYLSKEQNETINDQIKTKDINQQINQEPIIIPKQVTHKNKL